MASPNFYAAVYAIIRDKEGKILFSQRKNTIFQEGKYQLPAGHMDGDESMARAMARELKEEIDIDVREEDLKVVHISHRISIDREYFDVYIEVLRFSGTPVINEPEKCGSLAYFDIGNIDSANFVNYDVDVIKLVDKGVAFSEMNNKDYQ